VLCKLLMIIIFVYRQLQLNILINNTLRVFTVMISANVKQFYMWIILSDRMQTLYKNIEYKV